MFYYGFILVFVVALGTVDYFTVGFNYGLELWYVALAVVLSTVAVIAIDGISAFIIRWLCPKKWFSGNKTFFVGKRTECRFYEKLGIKKWKDRIPELGQFTDFHKNKISDPTNNEYVGRYITEANYGVVIHFSGIILGFLIVFIYPLKFWFCFGFPIALVNAFYNSLSLFILRYNLPKLHKLYRINEKRKVRQNKIEENAKTE